MTAPIDFEAEGLLDGVDGDAREARRELLEQLAADGASLEELKRAVAENRLAFLPVERVLAGDGRYTAREVAEMSGLDPAFQERQLRALGLAIGDPDERRSEEHTSELQSQFHLVCRLLLEKKKKTDTLA